MFQIQGKNKIGDFESIILDEKEMSQAVIYARKYFLEVTSVKNVSFHEEKIPEV